MPDTENTQVEENNYSTSRYEKHEITCPTVGKINVYVEGMRCYNEVVLLTVHDLGCDHTMYEEFVEHPNMHKIRDRTIWVHVELPGQGKDAQDLPADYTFPTMQMLGDELIHVLDKLRMKEVVCFGEGAGANILIRFAMCHPDRVLGTCLIHCTGTTAGFMESLKDKVMNWKLDHIGMNPTAEAYLVIHRFGSFAKAADQDQLKSAIENYQSMLRHSTNPKNLKKFVESFLKRSNITDNIKKLKCPALLVTGSLSLFARTTHSLHQALMKVIPDKTRVEFIEVGGVANVLEERPEKLQESLQYFLQGLGLISSVPMHHVARAPRLRSLSMEEYDQPKLRNRSMSGGSGASPLSASPPKLSSTPPVVD